VNASLFLIPTLPSAENVIYVFYIFMRVFGLLFVSPLLSNKAISASLRVYLGIFITIILALVLYPQYHPASPSAHLQELNIFLPTHIFWVAIISVKELAVGYVIGFCFNVAFEAMVMSGELIDSMIGFSTAQFVDPFSHTFHSLLGQLLVLSGALYMLIVDFHHVFIRMLAVSFNFIPLGGFEMTPAAMQDVILGTSWIYVYAMKFGAIPIAILALQLVGIGLVIRVVPEMNLLLTGLPMRVLFGLWTLMLAVSRIIPLFEESFVRITKLAEKIILDIGLK
jgi:flagellar biosynthetic protein FliR